LNKTLSIKGAIAVIAAFQVNFVSRINLLQATKADPSEADGGERRLEIAGRKGICGSLRFTAQ
jgi:hypothetical protein